MRDGAVVRFGPHPKPLEDRFWSKVDKRGADECWPWKAYRNARGYGEMGVDGRKRKAPRVAWELKNGPIPNGLHVCHHCDNPPCVNPAHLWLGTNTDNNQDKITKGRARGGSRPGESNGHAKLCADTVSEIRRATGTNREIADQFGIKASHVSSIRLGRIWKHVT